MASEVAVLNGVGFIADDEFRSDNIIGIRNGQSIVTGDISGSLMQDLAVENRVKRKAKRFSKISHLVNGSASCSGSLTTAGNSNNVRYTKNSRRSRNGFGRGLPKKGGAGGKGTWGKPGSELIMDDDIAPEDVRDPNYDIENQDNLELVRIVPELTEEDLDKTVDPAIHEYFEHGDTQELVLLFEELNLGSLKPQLVSMAVSLAMERKPSHCEMTSILLSDLYGHILSQEDIASGFEMLMNCLSDIVLDTPDASTILGNFIARAVADDCLPPKFVRELKGKIDNAHAKAALEHADALLSMKHGLVRLDNVWGVGGGMRPVKYLINQVQLILKEYLCSGDVEEASRCIKELEVPHFHHEIVYEALIMVIEDMGEKAMSLMCKLLKSLAASVIVTPDQMLRGFLRVYEEMPDICIDVPQAYNVLEKFVAVCQKAGFLSDEVIKKVPTRGRKRFVSEGDGGLVKNSPY